MLGSKGITKEFKRGNIVIEPFNIKHVSPNSYDITLGNWFILPKQYNSPVDLEIENLDDLWQDPRYISNKGYLILEPGQCVLTHTHEYIGSYKHAMLLKARSTFGRLFIDICPSAGFGDIGYVNRWTLEIKNNSNNYYILKPSMRIGQISFMEVRGRGDLYKGAYSSIREEYIFPSYADMWKPQDMLPKLGINRVF